MDINAFIASMGAFAIVLLLLGIVIYFIPAIIAFARGHRNKLGIFALNLFLGWTLIFYVIALVWACWAKKETFVVTTRSEGPNLQQSSAPAFVEESEEELEAKLAAVRARKTPKYI